MTDRTYTSMGYHTGVSYGSGVQFILNNTYLGYPSNNRTRCGGTYIQLSVNIPKDCTITNAYFIANPGSAPTGNTVNTRITGHKVGNAVQPATLADYKTARGTIVEGANNNYITTATATQDSLPAGTMYINSPNIASIISEIISLSAQQSGNNIQIFQDDHEARGTQTLYAGREVGVGALYITYIDPPWGYKVYGISNYKNICGISKSTIKKINRT